MGHNRGGDNAKAKKKRRLKQEAREAAKATKSEAGTRAAQTKSDAK
jgi:hypothetical protein